MILTKICERQYPLWTHRRQPTADLRSDYSPQLSVISCGLPLSFCKYVLGIRKKASNLAVRLELGRLPVENFIKSQTLLYFAWLYTTKLNPLLKEFFLLCQKFRFSRHLHMVFICKEYYWWDRSWYLTAPKY
jgi:hypothetical protein